MICKDNRALDCPCAAGCPRHGNCCECVSHHADKGSLPACLRDLKKKRKKENT
jgi:hypothetical protein